MRYDLYDTSISLNLMSIGDLLHIVQEYEENIFNQISDEFYHDCLKELDERLKKRYNKDKKKNTRD